MSSALALTKTDNMNQATAMTREQMRMYMESLINPFSTIIKGPKLLDGEVKHTAGLKLRATGEIICSPTVNTNIVIFSGLTNVICWTTNPSGSGPGFISTDIQVEGFTQHLLTQSDRDNVQLGRTVGAGARFYLTNSAEEDDGYWEAVRLTSHNPNDVVTLDTAGAVVVPPTTVDISGLGMPRVLDPNFDLANNPSYQSGHLRDIGDYIFKLNSTDNDHKFNDLQGQLADISQWDLIFIKIRGRRNAASPSVLRFDTVSNQELVYTETTSLGRLMVENKREDAVDRFLEYSRVTEPGFKVS